LELEVAIEVVLDRVLAATVDHEQVGDAGGDGLLHHVLDRGFVDDRQHLLRLALRGREEARAETGRRDDRLGDAHPVATSRSSPAWSGGSSCAWTGVAPRPSSWPRITRSRLLRCRMMMRPAITLTTDMSSQLAPRATTITVKSTAQITDATDALCSSRASATHTAATITITSGNGTTSTPAAVATPRPPLKWRVAGNTWPSTAARPRMYAPRWPLKPLSVSAPMPAASAPLPMSRASTSSPHFQPMRRKMFEAPGLREPSWWTSNPPWRATRSALGKLPSRYPTGMRRR